MAGELHKKIKDELRNDSPNGGNIKDYSINLVDYLGSNFTNNILRRNHDEYMLEYYKKGVIMSEIKTSSNNHIVSVGSYFPRQAQQKVKDANNGRLVTTVSNSSYSEKKPSNPDMKKDK